MSQPTKYRGHEAVVWHQIYRRVSVDEDAARLFVELAKGDVALRNERQGLYVRANLHLQACDRRRIRAESFGRLVGAVIRFTALLPWRVVSSCWRFASLATRAIGQSEPVPTVDPIDRLFQNQRDKHLMQLALERCLQDPVLREVALKELQDDLVKRIEAAQLESKAA